MEGQDPWKTLNITSKEDCTFDNAKKSFTSMSREHTNHKAIRVKIGLAYHSIQYLLNDDKWSDQNNDIFYHIISANIDKVAEMIKKNQDALYAMTKYGQYPTVYVAVRSGHYQLTNLLLTMGSWSFKKDRSTPMHCAAYYGHYTLVSLLLNHNIPLNIKNFCGHLPQEEASTDDIKRLFKEAKEDPVGSLIEVLYKEELAVNHLEITHQGKVVCKKALLQSYMKFPQWKYNEWVRAFHGTRKDVLVSIAKYGLKKPGEVVNGRLISTLPGHIQLNQTVKEIKNWACGIFTSPSIYYSCNPIYAKEVIDRESNVWLPVVLTLVRKGTYSEHESTTPSHISVSGEPTNLEYTVRDDTNGQMGKVNRSSSAENVVVIGIMFVLKNFLNDNKNFNEVTALLLDGKQEKEFRRQNGLM